VAVANQIHVNTNDINYKEMLDYLSNDASGSTTETLKKGQKPTIGFRLFNSNNNRTYFHVTYQILIQKAIRLCLINGLINIAAEGFGQK
jgi:hypothetical protein